MKRLILAALFLPFIISCASDRLALTDADKIAEQDDGYQCERVTVLGSNIPKKICSTQAQRDREKAASEEYLREVRTLRALESAR